MKKNMKVEHKRRKKVKRLQKENRLILKRQRKSLPRLLSFAGWLAPAQTNAAWIVRNGLARRKNSEFCESAFETWQRRFDEVNRELKVTDPPRAIESWCEMVGVECTSRQPAFVNGPPPTLFYSEPYQLRSWRVMLEHES